jgi:NAD-dependent DNA ligase
MTREEIKELINRRRRQVIVHSYIYYRKNENIIDDHTFDMWSKELVELQEKYPDIAAECVYAEYFKDFDGSSGFDLPTHLPEIMTVGERLLRYHKKLKGRATS